MAEQQDFMEQQKSTVQPVAKDINVPAKDCISRQAALDEKNIVHMEMFGRDFPVVPVATLKRLPPVDAAPVVRCRDCKHKDRESGLCHGRGWPMQLVPDDGFCDKGERKGEPDEH